MHVSMFLCILNSRQIVRTFHQRWGRGKMLNYTWKNLKWICFWNPNLHRCIIKRSIHAGEHSGSCLWNVNCWIYILFSIQATFQLYIWRTIHIHLWIQNYIITVDLNTRICEFYKQDPSCSTIQIHAEKKQNEENYLVSPCAHRHS